MKIFIFLLQKKFDPLENFVLLFLEKEEGNCKEERKEGKVDSSAICTKTNRLGLILDGQTNAAFLPELCACVSLFPSRFIFSFLRSC
jgi:hypothetical protein